MEIEDRKLSTLYRLGTAPAAGRPGCLSVEQLAEAAAGRDREARDRAVAHASECAACAEELRLALELGPWAERAGRAAPPARRSFPAWLPVAAGLLLALGVGLWLRGPRARETQPLRGLPESRPALEPADGSSAAAAPRELSWSAIPGARGYSVGLFDAESTPIWSSGRLPSPRVELPAEVRSRLAAGGEFLWRVTVFEDTERRDLPLARFRVSPPVVSP